MAELTPKQKRFCDEYLVDHNATQAAIRAGYPKKSAKSQASRLLTNVNVQPYLAARAKKIDQKLEISAERTLLEIARLAYTPSTAFYDENGELLPPHKLGADAAACLSGVDVEELWGSDGDGGRTQIGVLKKIRRFDKNPALDKLAKHFKLYVDTPAPPVNINLTSLSTDELKKLLEMLKKMNAA